MKALLLALLLATGCVARGGYYVAPVPYYYEPRCQVVAQCPDSLEMCCFERGYYPRRLR